MLFGDSGPDERPAFVVYELENDSLDGLAAQGGLFVKAADDLAAADRLGLTMLFTGVRHFRH